MKSLLQKRIITSFFLALVVLTSFLAPFSSLVNIIENKKSVSYAQAQPSEADKAPEEGLPACGPLNGALGTQGSLMGCVAMLLFYTLFRPASVIAFIAASFLDFFIGYSLSDTSYRNPFVEIGWKLIRDVSNIAFILVLLYVAIQGMFMRNGGSEFKRALPQIILMAILINFSLFFTRVIIDVSNITSRVFYNSIEITKSGTDDPANIFGTKSVSTAIATSINPQKIMTNVRIESGSMIEVPGQTKPVTLSKTEHASYYIIVILAAVVVCLIMAWVFFSSAFIFLGRIVGFYFAMIFSPFAFMSTIHPQIQKTDQIGWTAWRQNVTELAFVGPLFTFYLYLTAQFARFSNQAIGKLQASSGWTETAFAEGAVGTGADGFFPMLFSVMIPMAIITALLMVAQKAAKEHAGILGKMAISAGSAIGGAVLGVAAGVATGGLATIGRGTVGRMGSEVLSSRIGDSLRSRESKGGIGGWLAKQGLKKTESLSKASFDIRATKIGKQTGKQFEKFTGASVNQNILSAVGLTKDDTKGGYVGQVKRIEDAKKKEYEETIKRTADTSWFEATQEKANKYESTYKKNNPAATKDQIKKALESKFGKRYTDLAEKYSSGKELKNARRQQTIKSLQTPTILETLNSQTSGTASTGATTLAGIYALPLIPIPGTLGAITGAIEARKKGRMKALEGIEKAYKKEEKDFEKLKEYEKKINKIADEIFTDNGFDQTKRKELEEKNIKNGDELKNADKAVWEDLVAKQALFNASKMLSEVELLKQKTPKRQDKEKIEKLIELTKEEQTETEKLLENEIKKGDVADIKETARLRNKLKQLTETQEQHKKNLEANKNPGEIYNSKFKQEKIKQEASEIRNLIKNRDALAEKIGTKPKKDNS